MPRDYLKGAYRRGGRRGWRPSVDNSRTLDSCRAKAQLCLMRAVAECGTKLSERPEGPANALVVDRFALVAGVRRQGARASDRPATAPSATPPSAAASPRGRRARRKRPVGGTGRHSHRCGAPLAIDAPSGSAAEVLLLAGNSLPTEPLLCMGDQSTGQASGAARRGEVSGIATADRGSQRAAEAGAMLTAWCASEARRDRRDHARGSGAPRSVTQKGIASSDVLHRLHTHC